MARNGKVYFEKGRFVIEFMGCQDLEVVTNKRLLTPMLRIPIWRTPVIPFYFFENNLLKSTHKIHLN